MVLGGNGFICRNLVSTLASGEDEIYSFDLNIPEQRLPNVHYMEGDFFDDYVLHNAVKGMDIVYHGICTLNPGNSNDKYMQGYTRDLVQTVKLCDMLRENNARMIFLSSGGTVYGKQEVMPIKENVLAKPINHYGNLKLCSENMIRVFNIQNNTDFRVVRISNPYGPGQDYHKGVGFIDAALKRGLAKEPVQVYGDGSVVRDYIYIQDVCNVLAYLGKNLGKHDIINLGSGRGTSMKEILEIVRRYIPDLQVEYLPSRSVDVPEIYLDNQRLLHLYPMELTPLEEGIKKYYMYLKEQ
ncbi:MAG: NAD-dependent epimerase/dehydratase family protein [Lachnospiraceae bacterium]|nr:NAD-dependent epimerase/dehydratase family protein [Lachnospiraceae bacterium]